MNKRNLTLSVAVALTLGSNAAWSLGLGQLQVKSGLNQPLVAEIPIIASSPGEIDNLEVRLASPEAFERVGLVRPTHSTANLSFSVGKNARGQPVVLVTSSGKFVEPFLSFLVEADWGKGTVTKEYTALIDPPYIAKAVIRPLEAPTVAVAPTQTTPSPPPLPAETTIKLSPEPEAPVVEGPATAPQPVVAADASTPAPAEPPTPTTDTATPVATQTDIPPSPVVEPAPQPVIAAAEPAPAAVDPIPVVPDPAAANEYGPVAKGETLSKIVSKLDPDANGVSVKQMMMALLRANPDAFVDDNVNQLKRGAVMRIPGRDEAMVLTDEQASTLIAEQSAAWNARRAPVLQPTETVTQTNPEPQPEMAQPVAKPTPTETVAQTPVAKPSVSKPVSKSSVAPRLEIVPPSKKAVAAKAAQSGAASGAGGTELRAELTQAKEDVAVRDTQINELKSRVNDLEAQEAKRQQLIEMQNSQLKALQDELAKRNGASEVVPVEPISADNPGKTLQPEANEKPAAPAAVSEPAWYLNPLVHYAAGGALLLGGLIWLFRRRREPVNDDAVIAGRRISDDVDFQASLVAMKPKQSDAVLATSVHAALEDFNNPATPAFAAAAPAAVTATHDDELDALNKQLRSKPQDLEAHLSLLRYYHSRGEASSFETAAKAMRSQVSTVLDPRWREAVVMGVTLSPDNPLFNQSGWNTPKFANEPPATPVSTPSFVKAVQAQKNDSKPVAPSSAWDSKPEANTVTPIEEIGVFTDDSPMTTSLGDAAVADTTHELDADEGTEADLMVSDPASSTKIELASAYLDIGDVEGARSMLEEVVDHGSTPAKRLAQRLLKEIG